MKLFLSFASLFFVGIALASPDRRRMVLRYDHSVDLEDVAAALDFVGGNVERQLSCIRGLVVSVSDQGLTTLDGMEGLTVVPEANGDDWHARRLNGIFTPQGDGQCDYKDTCGNLKPVPLLTQDNVATVKEIIRAELVKGEESFDGSLANNAGALLRLAFHDAASFDKNDAANLSGLNGCVNKNNAGNAGLDSVQSYLLQLQGYLFTTYGIEMSIADLTVLAAITALEVTTEVAQEANPNYQGELDVEFKYGRPDINCECEEDFLPPALTSDGSAYNFEVLDDTMKATMGFTRKEIVALMGTHTLGAMSSQFSGFPASSGLETAPWVGALPFFGTFTGNDGFDNGYYVFIFAYPWDKKETVIDGVTFIEWTFGAFNFLSSDAALAFEIDFVDETGVACNRFGGSSGCTDRGGNPIEGCVMCPPLQNAYGQAARLYAEDQASWLQDYSKVFQKMVDDLVPCHKVKLLSPE